MKKSKKLLSLLLAAAMIVTIASGCKSRKNNDPESSSSTSSSKTSSSAADPTKDSVSKVLPDMIKYVEEKKALNSDTVGWLQIPEIGIDDVIVCNPNESNNYYLRLNFEKEYDFNGLFYADRRSVFGSGSPDELGVVTCIYGHAMTDKEDSDKFDIKFGPLHSFRDPEIAKHIPYIFFTTEKENLAFEVIAVFVANRELVAYNRNDLSPEEYRKLVKEEVLRRSIYNYDVELKDDDKYIVLSTCIYSLPDGTPTYYPDTDYRYAVMGRLVSPDDELKTEAVFTPNENLFVDQDTFKK